VLLDKWRVGERWCQVAEIDQVCVGYVLAHPWVRDRVPPLHERLVPPARPDCLFLHDLAIASAGRGRGLAAALFDAVRRAGEPAFRQITLVSLSEAAEFWQRRGFRPLTAGTNGADVSSYGAGACHMACDLLTA
jgi:GNAT superfamily N-acetyltransferase